MSKSPFSNFHYGPLAFLLAITGGFAWLKWDRICALGSGWR